MDLEIEKIKEKINNMIVNDDNNFKKLYIFKKLEEINEILNTNNFKELKNNEIKENIKLKNNLNKYFPYLLLTMFSETIE